MGAIAGILGAVPDQSSKIRETLSRRAHLGIEELEIPGGRFYHGISRKDGCQAKKDTSHGEVYDLVLNGTLYNEEEICRDLKISKEGISTADLILKSYLFWGQDCVKHFNGVFALAIYEEKQKKLFLARDPMGIKPLFYRTHGDRFLFGSEIKNILAFPGEKAALTREGAMELILLGPGRRPGSGVYENIRELEPGCRGIYRDGKLTVTRYWSLKDREHRENFQDTAEHVSCLIRDAVSRQTRGQKDYGCLLSGGLDSSILSALCREAGRGKAFQTFSVDYLGNDRNFVAGKFQPDSDDAYIAIMEEFLGSHHKKTLLTPEDLLSHLEEAALARDLPGMGDVDASLLAFSKAVKEKVPMVLSGECADEIFGGYPWFRDPEIRQQKGFPWAQNTALRKDLLIPGREEAEDFVRDLYADTIKSCHILPACTGEDRRIKELMQLNMVWFMQTLVDRNDRMSAAAGLDIRVPFCDLRIAQYLYGVPWKMKDHMGREKGLLRHAVQGLLPEEVRMRKKSPYPKTFDPQYADIIQERVRRLLQEDSPVWSLVSRQAAIRLLSFDDPAPFYGQLMKRPQIGAWLLQMDFLFKKYYVELSF